MSNEAGSLLRARQSADYWTELSIAEFTEGLRCLMRGTKQKDLAEAMGVTEAYISTILKGDENFTIQQMNKIAHYLGAAVHIHVAKRDKAVQWIERTASESRRAAVQNLNLQDLNARVVGRPVASFA